MMWGNPHPRDHATQKKKQPPGRWSHAIFDLYPNCLGLSQQAQVTLATKKHGKLLPYSGKRNIMTFFVTFYCPICLWVFVHVFEVLWGSHCLGSKTSEISMKSDGTSMPKLTPLIPSCLAKSGAIMSHQMFKVIKNEAWAAWELFSWLFGAISHNKKTHERNILNHYNL